MEHLRTLAPGARLLAALTEVDPEALGLEARVAMLEIAEAACHAVDALAAAVAGWFDVRRCSR